MNKIFILDFGSGNSCFNEISIIKEMINKLADIDLDRKFCIKWQLFEKAGQNIPLLLNNFNYAYDMASDYGYKTTASVFDKSSLDFLLKHEVPFVKIANRPDLYHLAGQVPRDIPVIFSISKWEDIRKNWKSNFLCCVSKYPAQAQEYEDIFSEEQLAYSMSDHTENFDLYLKYRPQIYECHYKLPNSVGLDAGSFARTSEQIKEIYESI